MNNNTSTIIVERIGQFPAQNSHIHHHINFETGLEKLSVSIRKIDFASNNNEEYTAIAKRFRDIQANMPPIQRTITIDGYAKWSFQDFIINELQIDENFICFTAVKQFVPIQRIPSEKEIGPIVYFPCWQD